MYIVVNKLYFIFMHQSIFELQRYSKTPKINLFSSEWFHNLELSLASSQRRS